MMQSLTKLGLCSALALGGMVAGPVSAVDLSGTWDNGSGIDFINPTLTGESICLMGCDSPPAAPAAEVPSTNPPRSIPEPDRPVYRPEFQDKVRDLEARQVHADPVIRCMPPGVPRIGPPDKIVQTATEIIFLYDDVSGNFFRVIPLDGRPHRNDVEASFLGDAVGRWEGDTLVVETVNFNEDTWLTDDGAFHTDDLKVVERLALNGVMLLWRATAYDPAVLAEPWELQPRTAVRAESEILEAPLCLERDLEHVVDETHHDNPR